MFSVAKLRKIDPELNHLSDEEIIKIRDQYYELGHLIFDDWQDNKRGSKNPAGLLDAGDIGDRIKT